MKTLIFVIAVYIGFVCVIKGQKTPKTKATSFFDNLISGFSGSANEGVGSDSFKHSSGSHDSPSHESGHTTSKVANGSKIKPSSGHAADGTRISSIQVFPPTDGFGSDGFGKASSDTNNQLDGVSVTNTNTKNSFDAFSSDGHVAMDSGTDGVGTINTETSVASSDPLFAGGFLETIRALTNGFSRTSTKSETSPNSNTKEPSAVEHSTSADSGDGFIVDSTPLPVAEKNIQGQSKPTIVEHSIPNNNAQSLELGSPVTGINNRSGGSTMSIRHRSRDRGTVGQRNSRGPNDRLARRGPLPRVITHERPFGRNQNRMQIRQRQDSSHPRYDPRDQPFTRSHQISGFGRPRPSVLSGNNPHYMFGSADRGSIDSSEYGRPLSRQAASLFQPESGFSQILSNGGFSSDIPQFHTTNSFNPDFSQSGHLPFDSPSSELYGTSDFSPMAPSRSFMGRSMMPTSSSGFRTNPFGSSSFTDSSIPGHISPRSSSHQFSTGDIGGRVSPLTGDLQELSNFAGIRRRQGRSNSLNRSQRPSGSLVGRHSSESSFPRYSSTSSLDFRPSTFSRSFHPTFSSTSESAVRSSSFPTMLPSSVHSSLPGPSYYPLSSFIYPATSRSGFRSFGYPISSSTLLSPSGSSVRSPSHHSSSSALPLASGHAFRPFSHPLSSSRFQSGSDSRLPSHHRSSSALPSASGLGVQSFSHPRLSSTFRPASGSSFRTPSRSRSSFHF